MTREMTPTEQLAGFLVKFDPPVARVACAALAKMRKLLPGALELVYDNYNALAIAFAPTDRASDAIGSIAVYPRWVSLFLVAAKGVPDPTKRLKGNGTRVRHVVLDTASVLDEPDIVALIRATQARAKVALDPRQRRQLLIKSVSKKQRPRRP